MKYFATFAAAAAFAATTVEAHTAQICCDALADLLPVDLHAAGTAKFSSAINHIWSVNARQQPWCVVEPHTVEDVSKVMKAISLHQCPFGIKGGGHSPSKLSNSVTEGVTIDMGTFSEVVYNKEKEIVSVGPGTVAIDVYAGLEADNVAVTVGRMNPVPIGGFATGGGVSFHANSAGWGVDTVLNFEMVLANGTIVNANANENPDLYLAQKGGSGNFGVITRFDMKPIHYPDPNAGVYGGMLVYDIDSTPEVFDAYVDFAGAHAEDIHTSVITMLDYSSTTGTHSFMAAPFNTENKHSAAIEKFVQLDGLTSNGLAHGKMSNMLVDADLDRYQIWYTGTYSTCREVMDYIKEGHIKLAADLTAALPEGTYFGLKSEYQPITKTMSSYGENIMGLEPHVENDTGILFLAWVYVETPEAYEISVPLVKAYYEDIEAYATSIGRNWDWLYLAYSNTEQDPISKYGAANIQKLQDVSRKYDPEGVFQHLRGSGFKLPAF